MNHRKFFSYAVFLFLAIQGCKKPSDNPTNPPVEPTQPDSIYVIKSIAGDFRQGDQFNFSYDTLNNLVQITRPYRWAVNNPAQLFYNGQKQLSHIVQALGNAKASAVFKYGSDGKVLKVYFKNPREGLPMDASYFYDLNDGNVHNFSDSLVYSSTGQLVEINEVSNGLITSKVKFLYRDGADTSLGTLEMYRKDGNNNLYLDDQVIIKTNSLNNPLYAYRFLPFLCKVAAILDGGFAMGIPMLFDDPSTYLGDYCIFSPRCIVQYKVNNNWGGNNYNSSFAWNVSADSTVMRSTEGDFSSLQYVNYYLAKVRKY